MNTFGTSSPLPRISVVIPCYNAEKWIARAIHSTLTSGGEDTILIVVDDGSTDASVERVEAFGSRVVVKSGPNRGACHARNEGMRIAKEMGSTYVLFLDADDYMEGPMLAEARKVAAETGADIVLSHMHLLHQDGRREERFIYTGSVAPEAFFKNWLLGFYINPSAILWRVGMVEKIGGWDETLSRNQDKDITLRAMFCNPLIVQNPHGAAIHVRANPTSVSRNTSRRAIESRMRVHLDMLERVPGTAMEPLIPLMHRLLYKLSRECFARGYLDLGRRGVEELSKGGFKEHIGSRTHRIAAGMLGLEWKIRILGQ